MHTFSYHDTHLYCESTSLAKLAEDVGTPCYVYSEDTIRRNFQQLTEALSGLDHRICYAMKANSNLAILRLMHNLGGAFDLVSGGEIERVLAAGGSIEKSVFAGVGKTDSEISLALEHGIYSFHVESEPELERINRIAGERGVKAPVALRINPDVDAQTHAKITTGKSDNKFGIPYDHALDAYAYARDLPNLKIIGVQMHIGSQITKIDPFVAAVKRMRPMVQKLKEKHALEYFSIGGGIGIIYDPALESGAASWWEDEGADLLTPRRYGEALVPLLKDLGLAIFIEPGRFMTGNAGALLTRVEYVKTGKAKKFVIVDAAMNDLARPSMYDAYHQIVPVENTPEEDNGPSSITADGVGPVCESGDCFAKAREMKPVKEGDLLAILSAGAYGFVMAGRYNTRALPAEVLVSGKNFSVINNRETFAQIIANENIPEYLRSS
ncbi:MAG: diaminopimelate decarboxylase [Opitutales bacterium]|nr:diaminopimelate decarboxylase [Opitutales bacterium]